MAELIALLRLKSLHSTTTMTPFSFVLRIGPYNLGLIIEVLWSRASRKIFELVLPCSGRADEEYGKFIDPSSSSPNSNCKGRRRRRHGK